MVELIDKAWNWAIVRAPSWKWTSILMHYRHQWYSRVRRWDDESEQWVKRV